MADDIVSQYYLANALRQGQRQSTRSILAQRMMGNALDTSPTTPLGALARALTGVVSAYTLRQAEEGDRLDQKQALSALMERDQQQQDEVPAWQARLNGQGAQPPAGGAAPAPAPVMREALPGIGGPAPQGAPQPAQPGGDLVPRIIQAEAGNQGPQGMAAVASVIQNRARLTGMTPEQVVQQAGQFEPWGRRRQEVLGMPPERFASAADIWRQVSGGQMPDPTGGATHFLNPDLQRQLGRPMPAWAPEGQGQRIGAHVFYARPQDFPRAGGAPAGAVEGSAPGDVQATLEALRQGQGVPGVTAAGGGALPSPVAAAPPAPAPAAPPVNMQVLAEGLGSRNPEIRRRAEAVRDALREQRQQDAAARQTEAAMRSAAAAERAAEAAGRGRIPEGQRINPQTGQLEDIPGMRREPFSGNSIDAQASNVLLRIGPRIANGTATDEERQQYALAHSHLTAPSLQQVPADPNDPSRGMALAMVPRRAPEGFPAPDFRPGAPVASDVPGSALPQRQGSPGAGITPATQGAGPVSQGSPATPGGVQIIPGTARGQPPLTEAQGRANMFGSQMRMGDDILRGVRVPSGAAQMLWRNAPEMLVNLGLSTNDQQYFNAVRLFAAGILRRETGAAFTQRELEDVQSRFFPMPGDSQEVIAQKAAARQQAISSLQAEIPGGMRGTVQTPAAGGAPAGPVTHRFNPQTGQVEAVN